jgi:hypothetical protein
MFYISPSFLNYFWHSGSPHGSILWKGLVSEVSVHHGAKAMVEQRSSHHGVQEDRQRERERIIMATILQAQDS